MGSKSSRETGARCKNDQGAEESNLGSMEHSVCHNSMVFYTVGFFLPRDKYTNCTLQY